ncbi:MAG: ethanolamine ammonia-lyase subunit EutC [Desulfobacter sp.]|nr:MAG: ethanolamine ammonia-lyase subunit EutC [Desulfobacter sp.]
MISEDKLKAIIEDVMGSLNAAGAANAADTAGGAGAAGAGGSSAAQVNDDALEDLAAVDLKKELLVPHPHNREMYLKLKETTPARIGIWRSGPRPLTRSLLRFRADHAVAQDAVFNNVSDEFTQKLGIETLQSCCTDKDEFLTRPDLGRRLPEDQAAKLKTICPANARVQIYIADGLSSTAVETNAEDTYKSIVQGLTGMGIQANPLFFLRYGRVPSMDVVSELITPEVTVLLIGERPGLATGESMSCYMAYKASTTMPEANRTVISNIHKGGTPAVEAGAHIAGVIKKMLDQKASGLDLKL